MDPSAANGLALGPRCVNVERAGSPFAQTRVPAARRVRRGVEVQRLLWTGPCPIRDFLSLLGPVVNEGRVPTSGPAPVETTPEEERLVEFVSFVLDDSPP